MQAVGNVAAVCLSIGYPSVASVPHMLINGFKNLLAVAAETEIEFKEAETLKEYLKVFINDFVNCFIFGLAKFFMLICWIFFF